MNSTVYIYGNLENGYTQFPTNYAKPIYERFINHLLSSSSQTEIGIYRDDSLMYYGYGRKLEEGQCIGFCVLLNGIMLTDFEGMFTLFEDVITHLVIKGELLRFTTNGEIVSKVTELYREQTAVNQAIEFIKDGFRRLEVSCRKLPPVSYGVPSSEVKQMSRVDNIEEIITTSHTYKYTFIPKSIDYNTQALKSYKSVVSCLNEEKESVLEELRQVQSCLAKVQRQKKQFRYVLVLLVVVIGCTIGLFSLNDDLSMTQMELNKVKTTNSELKEKIDSDSIWQIELLMSLSDEKMQRQEAESKIEQLAKSVPIIITDLEIGNTDGDGKVETDFGKMLFSAYTMYLTPRIIYTGVDINKSITLNIRFYTSIGLSHSSTSPQGYTYSSTMFVSKGSGNSEIIGGWGNSNKGMWSPGKYRIEVWYGDVCLKQKNFIVHR